MEWIPMDPRVADARDEDAESRPKRVSTCVRAFTPLLDRDPAINRIGFVVLAGAHAISSAETIEKWVNRSNVLPAALRLNGAAFSSLAHGAQ